MIVGVSRDLRGDFWGYVPRYLFWREDLDRDRERGFDLCLSFIEGPPRRCRALRGGFPYWDVAKMIQDCTQCQKYSMTTRVPNNDAITVRTIAIENSTKWVEAKPLTIANGRQAEKFTWEHFICKFKVPQTITSKDDKQFREGIFSDFYKGLKITQSFSPITEHVEIMNHIEKQLAQSQQGWVYDLARVLWAHRTLPRNSQNETPFTLTYGSEAMIPTTTSLIPESKESITREKAKRKESKEREVSSI
ncbi:reverse transcriptase domain-containing protein [Tanacetum coccineum]